MLNGIDAVCFDAFGTLVEILDKRRPYLTLLQRITEAERQMLQDRLMREPLTLEDCVTALGDRPEFLDITDIRADLDAELASITLRPQSASIWSKLRANGVKIAICSNLAQPYGAPLKHVLPRTPAVSVMSYEPGHIKPEPEIYGRVIEALKLDAGRILFTGDTPRADVEGPRAAGMKSMLISEFEADMAIL